jgi:hypothetical protein
MSRFAVMQTSLDIPPVDALQRAFRHVPFLIASDAHTIARDAFGILLNNQSYENAMLVHTALAGEGIQTDVIPQASVPAMPPTKFVKRIQLGDDGLTIFDPVGRSFVIQWGHFVLISAGAVKSLEPQVRSRRVEYDYDSDQMGSIFGMKKETEPLSPAKDKLQMDLILSRGVARYTLEADPVLLGHALGQPPGRELTAPFAQLAAQISARCPHAWLNRGATSLRDHGEVLLYPSRNAYQEEIIWLLWQMRRAEAAE